jgi:hypothetical protein
VGHRTKTTVAFQASNRYSALAVQMVGRALAEAHPQNVDRGSVTVTEEGESVGIVLVPHRDLGGLALVVWVTPKQAQLSWTGVSDLDRHDDLDLGKRIANMECTGQEWQDALRSRIITELQRNIKVTARQSWWGKWALWCTVDANGRPADFWVAAMPGFRGSGKAKVVHAGETSLQGPGRPTVAFAVPLEAWHRGGVAAWPPASQRDD